MQCKTKWNAKEQNSKQTVIKSGKVDQICKLYLQPVVFSKPLKILSARGTRPNEKNKCKCTPVKIDSKEYKTTIWSAEKQNVEQTIIKIGQSLLSMQAVYLLPVVYL